jgi:hypothetical protein
LLGLAAGAGLSLSALEAEAAIIDFESVGPAGTVINSQFPGLTISRTGSNATDGPPVVLDTANAPLADKDLQSPFEEPSGSLPSGLSAGPTEPGFILISNNNDDGCGDGTCDRVNDDVGATLRFDFDETVALRFLDLFDLDDGTSSARITLFDSKQEKTVDGNLVGDNSSVTVDIAQFFGGLQTDVSAFEVSFQGSGGLDNIVFDPPGTDVPEPATLALIGSGLLAAGALMRRRRRA